MDREKDREKDKGKWDVGWKTVALLIAKVYSKNTSMQRKLVS